MDAHQANQPLASGISRTEATEDIPGYASNGAGNYGNRDNASLQHSDSTISDSLPVKSTRRRNKPSLNCETCTVKKTKCDRARPTCFACIKRRSHCRYSQLADLIENSHQSPEPVHRRIPRDNGSNFPKSSPIERPHPSGPVDRTLSRSSTTSSPSLLSNIPFSHPTASNLFKAEHPFR